MKYHSYPKAKFSYQTQQGNQSKYYKIFYCFDRRLRLKYHFHQEQENSSITHEDTTCNNLLYPSSGWTPPSGQFQFLETYRSTTLNSIFESLKQPTTYFKMNLKKKQTKAITTLKKILDITIKPADKVEQLLY